MSVGRLQLERDSVVLGLGAMVTVGLAVAVAASSTPDRAALVVVGAGAALAAVAAFVYVPHWAIAATIPLFAVIPALKWFVLPWSGGAKDALAICAVVAATIVAWRRHQRGESRAIDPLVLGAVLVLCALYLIDAGGDHSGAWRDGVRLALGPLFFLVAGFMLENPRRNLSWAVGSLSITAIPVAIFGLVQQVLGPDRLVDLGYSYAAQIRTIDGQLRSFGTFDDAFAYTSFLLIAAAALLAWCRPRAVTLAWAGLLVLGAAVGFVRTAALMAVVIGVGLLLQSGRRVVAAGVVVGCAAIALGLLALAGPDPAPSSEPSGQSRTAIWAEAIGPPDEWLAGRGVGQIGTAAERQEIGAVREESDPAAGEAIAGVVDSGYVGAIVDVGLLGLVTLVLLLGRLGYLAYGGIRTRDRAGWVAMLALLVLCIDAITRASFTAFPTAYLAFLLIGVSLAAVGEGYPPVRARIAATTGLAEPSRR